jgi:integrase/recombinase XerD
MKLSEVIEQYLLDCENRGRSDGTIGNYQRQLGLLVRWLAAQGIQEIEEVTVPLMRQFLNYLKHSDSSERYEQVAQAGKLADSTVGTYVGSVKAFFQWCFMEELISANPAARLRKPTTLQKVRPVLTPDEVERLLACCDQTTRAGYRNYVMLLLLLDTGIRVSELCSLRLTDVHQRYIKVHGKGHKEREIGVHPDVSKMLWKFIHKYRGAFPIESEYVFIGEKGQLTVGGVESIFDALERESGVKVAPHKLRHTHSKEYLKQGGDLFKLSRELGHSSVQVTGNVYLSDFKSADAIQDHEKYSAVNSVKMRRARDEKKSRRRLKDD